MKVLGDGAIIRREDKPKSKCRKWTLRVQTDCGRKEKRFSGTFSEAKRMLDQFKAEITTDLLSAKFSDYAAKWYDRRVRGGKIAESTLKKDRNILRILNKKFGAMMLEDITYGVAIDKLLEIKTENEYSDHYYNDIFVHLKSLFISGVKDGVISKNVLDGEPAPKIEKTKRRALSVDEFQSFALRLSVEPLNPHIIAVYLAMYTGSRRGEICGFTWNDVDFDNKVMYVRRSITESCKAKSPKSTAGFRAYPIIDDLVNILRQWQRVQDEWLKRIEVKQTMSTPIVNNDLGKTMNPLNLDRWWRDHREGFGVDGLVLHELRHTYLTMLANNGAPAKVIQDVAGWSSIVQANTYVHSDMSAQRRAVESLGSFLGQ